MKLDSHKAGRFCLFAFSGMLMLLRTGILNAEIQLPENAAECVQWAAGDVIASLQEKYVPVGEEMIHVSVHDGGHVLPASISAEEQEFSLRVNGQSIAIDAGGAVGAMYGLEELTEQIKIQRGPLTWKLLLGRIHNTSQRQFLEVREENMFIHVYPLLLHDLAMWRSYIDMLARNRYNLLDLPGAYDLESTSFPNLYPMLVHVPDYPQVGNEAEQKRNLDDLRSIIAYAASRGIRVALMNYSANNGRGGAFKNEPSVTGVPPEKLADYTAKAVTLLIRQLPGLYMLGFRVGESTQPATFYQDAYLKGIKDAGRPDLRLYTRSWQTTKEQLMPIAQAARYGFDIEIKFNGEHLGLPYQAMQGAEYGSYSYQNYLDVPAPYRILWQIRANGTHRFWAWENTNFIRRTVRACRLGNARGFTLEPHVAYFSVYPSQYYRKPGDVAVYKYIWQKHWMWYYAWGRIGYNPDLSESNLIRQYKQHYGAAGEKAYAAMQQASVIVPLAYAYRCPGPDQRDFSPETETGNFDTKKTRARQDLLQFAENKPEDQRTFVGIDEFITEKLSGKPDGRKSPFAVARIFADASAKTRAWITAVPQSTGHTADEWRLLKADLLAASFLGNYYAARVRGMTHLDFALHTGSEQDYNIALRDMAQSRAAWKHLGEEEDAIYHPLSNPLRHQTNFTWSSQNVPLARLDATAEDFWKNRSVTVHHAALKWNAAGVGKANDFHVISLQNTLQSKTATIRCIVRGNRGVNAVVLWWKPLPSEFSWQSLPMKQVDGSWIATVPLAPNGLMYMVQVQDTRGEAENFPDEANETPYRVIPAFPDIRN
jgi:Tfp pilus assembly major pilin PilA